MAEIGTRPYHEFMVQSRGGHSSIVTATLEHTNSLCSKLMWRWWYAIKLRNILNPDCCIHPLDTTLASCAVEHRCSLP